jgi:DNA-binding transcriptional MocR family regulator
MSVLPAGSDKNLCTVYRYLVQCRVMLSPPDILVLLALLETDAGWTLRSVADRLGVKHSLVQRGLQRLELAGLYDPRRRMVNQPAAEEFLLHGVRYLQPAQEGPLARGVPTAWAAAPLKSEITSDDQPPVWPTPTGEVRGPSVEPLHECVPDLVETWPEVAGLASLVDALRIGDARTREAAARHLRKRVWAASEH